MKFNQTYHEFSKKDGFVIHDGYVSKINDDSVTVTLKGDINCEACHVKGSCGMAETEAKQIEVDASEPFQLNDNVEVFLNKSLGLKAVFWAYVFPFMLLISTLVITNMYVDEWLAGLLSLVILIPYYTILYVLRQTYKKAFKISVLKITSS
jgi:sigma-E factor negative regulatory protein RseC